MTPTLESTRTYFHGGQRGLRVGDFILPPAETKKLCTSDIIANRVHCRDRVYVTPDFNGAALYAAVQPVPMVYEVIPDGNLEPDPDCDLPGLSFSCLRAKIVAVHKLPGKLIKKARKAIMADARF
mgnify:CR=1 FL=1